MIRIVFPILLAMTAPAGADTVYASRTIRPESVLTADDMILRNTNIPGMVQDPQRAIGLETRVALYAGRPIKIDDIGPPTLIRRNQIVSLHYTRNGLRISTEGRALMRGGMGDMVRVMNLTSRTTILGQVQQDGTVQVSK